MRKTATLAVNASMRIASRENRPKRMTVVEVRIVPISDVLLWPYEPT